MGLGRGSAAWGAAWVVAACAGLAVAPAARGQAAAAAPASEVVYWDSVDERGELFGGRVVLPVEPRTGAVLPAEWTLLSSPLDGVLSGNRVNIVVVGDGYQSSQQALFNTHADLAMSQMFNQEPFRTYAPLFNVFRVNVVSVDAGVDNDPVQGILRNTAMDMAFWCNATERLLCVNVTKARSFANNAPLPPDQILALANSTKYGGAGYTSSDLATSSGGNASAPEIAIHEFGHSLGDLADEYDYGGPATYTGPERHEPNVSILPAAQMTSTKWFRWLNVSNPAFDGTVSTFQGAYYSPAGVYRPTNNSKMRNLGRPFNLPSAEALVVSVYKKVRPIESATPNAAPLEGTPTVSVTTVQPVNNPLSIRWSIDGVEVPGATGPTLDLSAVAAAPGARTVRVTVVDQTFMVRDPALRSAWLTQSRSWSWNNPGCYANCDGSTSFPSLNALDFSCFLARFQAGDAYANCDGSTTFPNLNALDFACFLNLYRAGCP